MSITQGWPPQVVPQMPPQVQPAPAAPRLGVIVSGGAPTVHLAAGALCAFSERDIKLQVLASAGAGALPALLYAAPTRRPGQNAKTNRENALKSVVNLNLYDAIYHFLPNNIKVFHKYGPFSQFFWRLGQRFHKDLKPDDRYHNAAERLYNDLVDLVVTAFTPTTLRYHSPSVLTRVQVINELVDWDELKQYPGEFFLNGFGLEDRTLSVFTKDTMTPEAFYAALAMPWLYPPTDARGKTFTEGASHDPSALEAAMRNVAPALRDVDIVVILDTIGPDVWVDPESTLESLALTILDPMIALTENVVTFYALEEHVINARFPERRIPRIYRLPFDLTSWERGKLWDWSYSNSLALWEAGYASAHAFCGQLVNSVPNEQFRQIFSLVRNPRTADLLTLFGFKPHPGVQPPDGAGPLFA
jgi:predicted acylesterase/phospholipase RssA